MCAGGVLWHWRPHSASRSDADSSVLRAGQASAPCGAGWVQLCTYVACSARSSLLSPACVLDGPLSCAALVSCVRRRACCAVCCGRAPKGVLNCVLRSTVCCALLCSACSTVFCVLYCVLRALLCAVPVSWACPLFTVPSVYWGVPNRGRACALGVV